jgi:hypothetical protein
VLALFTLTRCRLVSDRLTGIDLALSRKSAATCIVDCQRAANHRLLARHPTDQPAEAAR